MKQWGVFGATAWVGARRVMVRPAPPPPPPVKAYVLSRESNEAGFLPVYTRDGLRVVCRVPAQPT